MFLYSPFSKAISIFRKSCVMDILADEEVLLKRFFFFFFFHLFYVGVSCNDIICSLRSNALFEESIPFGIYMTCTACFRKQLLYHAGKKCTMFV